MRLLCCICLLLLTNGFAGKAQAPPVTLAPPLVDTKAILQQTFSHFSLAKYLVHYNPDSAIFRYEALPVYNGKAIPKPTFYFVLSKRLFICRTAYKPPVHDRGGKTLLVLFIDVTRVNINHTSALVSLKIPNEGIASLFWLARAPGGTWRVINYSTYET